MRVAIIHEWLVSIGGAEEVLQSLLALYPQAQIYTLFARPQILDFLGIDSARVHQSCLSKIPFANKYHRHFFPLFPYAVEQFDLRSYDLIISSSHCATKGVLTKANQLHICYCHSPVRYVWDLYLDYLENSGFNKGFFSPLVRYALHRFRLWDQVSATRPDFFIANSEYIARRIFKVYRREAEVIYPPVEVEDFASTTEPIRDDYYISVARLVPYKKMDEIARAFVNMPNKRLVLIGDGPDEKKLRKLIRNNANINYLGAQSRAQIVHYLQRARGFIFMADEDFGISPVEAQAAGTPVIAYAKGGLLETVIPNKTGVFFPEATAESLTEAIAKFEELNFDYSEIRSHAQKFSVSRFQQEFQSYVLSKQSI